MSTQQTPNQNTFDFATFEICTAVAGMATLFVILTTVSAPEMDTHQFLGIPIFCAFVLSGVRANRLQKDVLVLLCILGAVLFNPFLPVDLKSVGIEGNIWLEASKIAAAVLAFILWFLKK